MRLSKKVALITGGGTGIGLEMAHLDILIAGYHTNRCGRKRIRKKPRRRKKVQQYRSTLIPVGRVGHVSDISNAAVFLGYDESNYINGIELRVDGGLASIYPMKL